MPRFLGIVLLVLLRAPLLLAESSPIEVGAGTSLEISNRVDLLLDPDRKLTFQDVSAPGFTGFKPNQEVYPSFGAFPGLVWTRFQIKNTLAEADSYVIALNVTALDARLYVDGQEMVGGRMHPDDESFPSRMPAFLVKFGPQETKTLYLAIRSDVVYSMKLRVSQWEPFFQIERFNNYFTGFYVGIMVIMILYNGFLFVATRDISFLWYVLTVFFLHLHVIGGFMTNGDFFGHKNPILPEYFIVSSKLLGSLFLVQFSRVFLRTASVRKLDLVLKAVMATTPVFLLLFLVLPVARVNALHNLFLLPAILAMMSYSGYLFSRGLRFARFYFIAWFPVLLVGLVSVSLNMMKMGNVIHNSGLLLMGASVIEVLLLSMALGDKINEMRAEKEREEQAHKAEVLEMNRSLELKVKEKTQDIRSMLDNLKLGIFTVNRQMQIGEDYSLHLVDMVGAEHMSNLSVMNVLFRNADLGADAQSQVESALFSTLGFDELGYIANETALIKQYSRKVEGSSRDLELDWSPIISENGLVEKVLVSVKDVTEINSLRRESEIQRRKVEIIEQCLSLSWEQFEPLKDELEKVFANAHSPAVYPAGLFATLHTQKALTRKYHLTWLSDAIHQAEDYLHKVRDGHEPLNKEFLQTQMQAIQGQLDRYVETYQRLRGDGQASGRRGPQRIEQLLIEGFSERDSIARELGKPTPTIQLSLAENIHLTPHWARAIETMMLHLLRNSMDHGLEKPNERQAKGKPAGGTISVRLLADAHGYTLEYADDGAGLNLAKVKSKGLERGLIKADRTYSDQEIAELVFASGLSTKDEVSTLSGRGVGLDAVASSIRELGGQISVRPQPLAFVVHIPRAEPRKAQA